MKWFWMVLGIRLVLGAMDERDVEQEIASVRSVEALSERMEQAPKQYRQRYLEAIKTLVSEENEAKRGAMMHSLTGSRGGGNGGAQGGGSGGSGSGGGSGGGGGGKGGGGKGGK